MNIRIYGLKSVATTDRSQGSTEIKEETIIISPSEINRDGVSTENYIELKSEEFLELEYDDNSTWFINHTNIHEIAEFSEGRDITSVQCFQFIEQSDRGWLRDIIRNIFKRKSIIDGSLETLANELEKSCLRKDSGKEYKQGVYTVESDGSLIEGAKKLKEGERVLLFIHGTHSSFHNSFEHLIKAETEWKSIYEHYKEQVICLQHYTLSVSPFTNLLLLLRGLPKKPNGIELDLFTTSRGGLVGELLCYFIEATKKSDIELKLESYFNGFAMYKREEVAEIIRLVTEKKITVTKFMRSACPAMGTHLLSERTALFLNVTFNLIKFSFPAGSPIIDAARKLLLKVLDKTFDDSLLPGLASMNPENKLIKLLNNVPSDHPVGVVLNQPLIIFAANAKMQFKFATIITRLIHWEENDWVVHTRSMYQGLERNANYGVQSFYLSNKEVQHMNYWNQKEMRDALMNAIKANANERILGFEKNQAQGQGNRGDIDRGELTKILTEEELKVNKPVMIILPGIMGSNLYQNPANSNRKIWLNYLRMFAGQFDELTINYGTENENIQANSVIKSSYEKITNAFSQDFHVELFPYDWRHSIEDAAIKLSNRVDKIRESSVNQKIYFVAHSMGGLVYRSYKFKKMSSNSNWDSAMNPVIYLGSPLKGSYRIPAVLFGEDKLVKQLAAIDMHHDTNELTNLFVKFKGLANLLPVDISSSEIFNFGEKITWENFQIGKKENWFKNTDELTFLTKAYNDYKIKLTEIYKDEGQIYDNSYYIAGKAESTPCDMQLENGELVFYYTAAGDASVTWASGIPQKIIDAEKIFYSQASHGGLPNDSVVIETIKEIINESKNYKLSSKPPKIDDSKIRFKQQVKKGFFSRGENEQLFLDDFFDRNSEKKQDFNHVIDYSVSCKDLQFAKYPILCGHFSGEHFSGAGLRIDHLMNNILSKRAHLGLYPQELRTSAVVYNKESKLRGVIIVGLGRHGDLSAYELTQSIQNGVMRYLMEIVNGLFNEEIETNENIGLTVLLIGTNSGGISVDTCIRSVLTGVSRGNQKVFDMFKIQEKEVKLVRHIEFLDVYEDKALNAFYRLKQLQNNKIGSANVIFGDQLKYEFGAGGKKRHWAGKGGMQWDRLTVERILIDNDNMKNQWQLRFSLTSNIAKEEVARIFINRNLLSNLLDEISNKNLIDLDTIQTLYEMLIPNQFKLYLTKQTNLQWVVDNHTAVFPWEMLFDTNESNQPIVTNSGMIRRYITESTKKNRSQVLENNVLVIADPDTEGYANQLSGARSEGARINDYFRNTMGYTTEYSSNQKATPILKNIFKKDYKVIHYSGHGFFDPENESKTGLLIGKDCYLTVNEISQMSAIPDFVFINSCYSGALDPEKSSSMNGIDFAANIGFELIDIGVKAAIIAGWQIDDLAAEQFAVKFYEEMYNGRSFGEAVKIARNLIFSLFGSSNTWGAYQCYGDPYYQFNALNIEINSSSDQVNFLIQEELDILLFNINSDLKAGLIDNQKYQKLYVLYEKRAKELGLKMNDF